jgi:hypothetical protein
VVEQAGSAVYGAVRNGASAVSTAAGQFGCGFSGGCSIFNPNNVPSGAYAAGNVAGGTLSTLGTIANYGILAAAVIPSPIEPEAAAVRATEEAVQGGTTLYRAVEPGELADIQASGGAYRVPEGIGNGKYFYPTQEQAANFSNLNPGRSYTITSAQFPNSILSQSWSGRIAGEGPPYFIPGQYFPYGPVTIGGPLP